MRIAKWLGDGCMVVGVEQQSVIEFVTDLEHRASRVCAPLTLRAGIATGRALLFEGDDYIGSAVNMASRLCDHAQNVDVLMPTMHLDRLPEGVDAEPVRRGRAARASRAPSTSCDSRASRWQSNATTPASSGPAAPSSDTDPGPQHGTRPQRRGGRGISTGVPAT